MAKLLSVDVVAADSNVQLAEKLNLRRVESELKKTELKFQYVAPTANAEDGKVIWSALVEEYEGHPFG